MVFAYYLLDTFDSPCPLNIQIKELILENSNYIFKNVINDNNNIFEVTTEPNDFSDHFLTSIYKCFLIQLSNNKFCFSYVQGVNNIIILTILTPVN